MTHKNKSNTSLSACCKGIKPLCLVCFRNNSLCNLFLIIIYRRIFFAKFTKKRFCNNNRFKL